MDVVGFVPAGTKPNTTLRVLGHVQPAAGQQAETNPLGAPAVTPATDAGSTPTDNDDSEAITID